MDPWKDKTRYGDRIAVDQAHVNIVYLAVTSKSCLGMGLQVHICICTLDIIR